jgi:purine-binding chemotaxis protein CheW
MKQDLPAQNRGEKGENVEEMPCCAAEDLYEKEEAKEETRQFIVFRLSREWFGVEVSKVKEVIRVDKITYLPSCPEHVAGIVSLRGNILPVADLKRVFHLAGSEPTGKQRIIAIESGSLEIGFWVDEVVESIEVPVNRIEPALITIPAEESRYIDGQCQVGHKLIAVVNVERVLEKRHKEVLAAGEN